MCVCVCVCVCVQSISCVLCTVLSRVCTEYHVCVLQAYSGDEQRGQDAGRRGEGAGGVCTVQS